MILNDEGKILLGQRGPGVVMPGRWECPGGKVEPGESLEHALHREMDEELDIRVRVGHLVSAASFNWRDRYHILLSRCYIREGTPVAKVHQSIDWFDFSAAFRQLPLMPSHFVWFQDMLDEITNHQTLYTESDYED